MHLRRLILPVAILATLLPVAPASAIPVTAIAIDAPAYASPADLDGGIKVGATVTLAGAPAEVKLPQIPVEITVGGKTKSGYTNPQTGRYEASFRDTDFSPMPSGPVGVTAVALNALSAVPTAPTLEIASRDYATILFDTAVPAPGLSIQIDSGANHTCALISDATARCWGSGDFGQIGNGSFDDAKDAKQVLTGAGALSDVRDLDVGMNHACAITGTVGHVWCWGANFGRQLGTDTSGPPSPVAVQVMAGTTPLVGAVSIAAGNEHSCAVLADGTARCWGREDASFLGGSSTTAPVMLAKTSTLPVRPMPDAIEVAAGQLHTCIRRYDGSVWCFGTQTHNRLGQVLTDEAEPRPVPNLAGALKVAAGRAHTCALTATNAVCWGFNLNGQLGRGDTTTVPAAVSLTGTPSAMALGATHSCFVVDDTTSCTGRNANAQFGNGTTTSSTSPVPIAAAARSISVSAGDSHTCFLGPSAPIAIVRCAGLNAEGQLGDGTLLDRPAPATTGGLLGVAKLAAGTAHTCALLAGGTGMRCWGDNDHGQLGDTTTTDRLVPTALTAPANVYTVEAGANHTCVLAGTPGDATGDALHCWGSNAKGQLGNGSTTNATAPTLISGVQPIAIALGTTHTCAILPAASGQRKSLRCWGNNAAGQLGDGTTTDRSSPTPVSGLTGTQPEDILGVAAGTSHTCAALSDGSVRCWGSNASLQLGTTSVAGSTAPRQAEFVAGATGIVAGTDSVCVTVTDNSVQCWGSNSGLQLGYDGPNTSFPTTEAANAFGVNRIASGASHVCAFFNGTLTMRCWGSNASGQIGKDLGGPTATSNATSPVGLEKAIVIDFAAGGAHTCAVLRNATVRCWGANGSGQLGNASTTSSTVPVAIPVT